MFKGWKIALKLKYAGYREIKPDMYWHSAFSLARGVNPRKVRILQRDVTDTLLQCKTNVVRVHTIDHDQLNTLNLNSGHAYIRNLAEAIMRAANEK